MKKKEHKEKEYKEIELLEEYKKNFNKLILEEEKEGFKLHLCVYIAVITGTLLYLYLQHNLTKNVLKPILIVFGGWTIAIIIHYWEAFYWIKEHINTKEEKAIKKLKQKLKEKNKTSN